MWLVACGWWLVAGGWWLVAGGWWLAAWWQGRTFSQRLTLQLIQATALQGNGLEQLLLSRELGTCRTCDASVPPGPDRPL